MSASRPARLAVVPAVAGAAITGPVADIAALMEHLHATGAIVSAAPGRDALHVTLPTCPLVSGPTWGRRAPRTWRAPASWRRIGWPHVRAALVVLAVLALAAFLSLAVWVVWVAIAWVMANLAFIGAVLAGLAVLVVLAGGSACTTTVRITHRH